MYVYLGFYGQLQFLNRYERERERESENLRVHFWILKGLNAMHDRPQKQKTFLVDFLLNEVILISCLNTIWPNWLNFHFRTAFKLSKF